MSGKFIELVGERVVHSVLILWWGCRYT